MTYEFCNSLPIINMRKLPAISIDYVYKYIT